MKPKPLLLASASPRRKQLMARLKVSFKVSPARTRELSAAANRHLTPTALALSNARRKARAATRKNPGRHILAADTIVVLRNRILGKPSNRREAASFLRRLSGHTHQVLTAVVLLRPPEAEICFVERSDVTFHRLSCQLIQDYLATVPVLDKAGAYACQETRFRLIKKIRGLRSNVIGLPVERLRRLLTKR
jgi:septum formation protein